MVYPSGIYLFKINNGNIQAIIGIYSKLTTKTLERRRRRSGISIVSFEQSSHIALVSIVLFELINADWALVIAKGS